MELWFQVLVLWPGSVVVDTVDLVCMGLVTLEIWHLIANQVPISEELFWFGGC